MDNLVAKLYQTPKTVLNNKDLALIWRETSPDNLKSKIAYYVKKGVLIRLTRGVFAKEKTYDPKELANSIYRPSYISFETALREAGIIFQHYDTIFVAGPWSTSKKLGKTTITFRKMKDAVIFNPTGVENRETYGIASPERAFLDTLYLFPEYHFDNLRPIDWEKCRELVEIYDNAALAKRLENYRRTYAE